MTREKKHQANRFGRQGEALTVWALRLKGYSILERGRKVGRNTGAGEVDIIARRGKLLAFVEVKSRRDGSMEVLSRHQQERISRAAAFYLANHPEFAHDSVRFDVAIIRPRRWPLLIENAWQAE